MCYKHAATLQLWTLDRFSLTHGWALWGRKSPVPLKRQRWCKDHYMLFLFGRWIWSGPWQHLHQPGRACAEADDGVHIPHAPGVSYRSLCCPDKLAVTANSALCVVGWFGCRPFLKIGNWKALLGGWALLSALWLSLAWWLSLAQCSVGEPIVSLLGQESWAQEKKENPPSSTLHNLDKKHVANSHIDFFINDNILWWLKKSLMLFYLSQHIIKRKKKIII